MRQRDYERRLFRILSVRPGENQHVTLECIEHVPGLDRQRFLKRPKSVAELNGEPSSYIAAPEELLFDDSVKGTWAKRVNFWASGSRQVWYQPKIITPSSAITLATEAAEGDVFLVQMGNSLLRPKTSLSDTTGEWSVTGDQLFFHGFAAGPDDDVRIAYVPRA